MIRGGGEYFINLGALTPISYIQNKAQSTLVSRFPPLLRLKMTILIVEQVGSFNLRSQTVLE